VPSFNNKVEAEDEAEKDIEILTDSDQQSNETELKFLKFPGEIESESDLLSSISKFHCTQLNISTKAKEEEKDETHNELNDDNNLVKPFELDPNYDYNQHIFSPRYTILN